MKLTYRILGAILILLLVADAFILGSYYPKIFQRKSYINVKQIDECEDMDLFGTAYCLNSHIKGILNYTIREETIKTYEDIKDNGGDCYDYSHLYLSFAQELGFNAETVKLYNEEEGHIFTIMWDDNLTGYCKLDLQDVDCIEMVGDKLK